MQENNPPQQSGTVEIRYIQVPVSQTPVSVDMHEEQLVDLTEMLRILWNGKAKILYTTLIFSCIGLIYAFTAPKEYTVTVKVIPEVQAPTANMGRLGGLAAQFGLGGGLSSGTLDFLPVQMYPEILASTNFLSEIISKSVYFELIQDSISYQQYFNEYQKKNPLITYSIGLPNILIGLFRNTSVSDETNDEDMSYVRRSIPPKQLAAMLGVRKSVELDRDESTGIINITVRTQHPEVSFYLSEVITNALSSYLTTYKTEKARNNLEFIQERLSDSRAAFESVQISMAEFVDQSKGALTESARMYQQRLQSEYNVKFNVYNNLTEQAEQAKIKIQEDTPVLNVIQPPLYPNRPSAPNSMIIVIVSVFLGLFTSIAYLILAPIGKKFKEAIIH